MRQNGDTLHELIRLKELELELQGQILKTHFKEAAASLKPSNLVNNANNDLTQSEGTKEKLLGLGLGLVAGFVSKKIITSNSKNPIAKLAGNLVQVIISSVVANKSDKIKDIVNTVVNSFTPSETVNAPETHESES